MNQVPRKSASDPVAASLLAKAREATGVDGLYGRMLVAAAVAHAAEGSGIEPIVVGGTAADFYIAGAAMSRGLPAGWEVSLDLDLVALAIRGGDARRRLGALVREKLLFRPDLKAKDSFGNEFYGRGFTIPGVPVGLEIVDDELDADEKGEHVVTVEVEKHPVRLRSPEDVLVNYAESGWDTWQGRDWERALAIWRVQKPAMDMIYLRQQAAARRIPGVLEAVVDQKPLAGPRRPLF
ncbi:MAG: hypothetical protein ACYDDF_03555 [Thermoplasmatota archaeon]